MELTFMGIAQNKLSKGSTPIFSCMLCDSTPRSVSPSVGWAVGWLVSWSPFLAAAPKGQCPVGHRGEPLIVYVCPSPPPKLLNPQIPIE